MATCSTPQWSSKTTPQVTLTVTIDSNKSTGTKAVLNWTLKYVTHGYTANTTVKKEYTATINGDKVASGSVDIDDKTSFTIASGTKTINKTTSTQTISFSCSFGFNLTWSDVYGGTKTASGTISIPAKTSYTVSYNANGGSGAPSNQTKWDSEALTLSSTKPTRTGYTFKGWGTSSSDTSVDYASGASYTANKAITLYAIWEAITYTVKYNANGGSGAPANQTKTYGKTLTLSSEKPTRSSVDDSGVLTTYTFKGWATSSTSTSVAYAAGSSYTENANITLYAVWSKTISTSIFDVSYNANGGSGVISQIKTVGETLKLRDTIPVKNGYAFAGWGLSADSTTVSYYAGDDYTLDKDIILYAIWTPWSHTVVFDVNGGSGNAPENFIKTTGVDIVIPNCSLTQKGHVFKYWSTQQSGSGGTNYRAGDGYNGVKNGGTVTLYAIWDETSIYLYANGECKAGEFIEDEHFYFNNDGTFHYAEFIESDSGMIHFGKDAFYAKEFLERVVARLTDESDVYLTDEYGNNLTTII